MFEELDEQVEKTEGKHSVAGEHMLRFAGLIATAILVFGGLFAIVLALE